MDFQQKQRVGLVPGARKSSEAERLVSAGRVDEDDAVELKLRPQKLAEFIGQTKAKQQLKIALEAAKDMALKALTIPDDLRRYLTRANRGEAEVRVKGLAQAASLVYRGVRQLIYTALGLGAGYGALQLYLAGHVRQAQYCLYGAGAMGALLLLSIAWNRSR